MKNLTKNHESIYLLAPMTKLINAILLGFEIDTPPFSLADIHNLYFYQDAAGKQYVPEMMDLRLYQLEADLNKTNLLLDILILTTAICYTVHSVLKLKSKNNIYWSMSENRSANGGW